MRSVKRQLLIILLFVLLSFSFIVPSQADSNDDTLTVGVPVDRCPIIYTENDEIVGIGAELMRLAAEEAGYSVSFREIEEETLKDALDSEAYDILMPFGSAITSTSGKPSIVTDNLLQTPFTLVTEGKHKPEELNSIKVGMLSSLGGAKETVSQMFPGIEITLYDTIDECVKALRAGKVDALLHNSYVWSYVLQKPSYSDLTVQPSAMFSMDFRAGTLDTPKGRETAARLNEGIANLSETQRQAVILDYTSRRLYHYDFSDYLSQYGPLILMGVLLFGALIIIAVQKQRSLRQRSQEMMRKLIDYDPLTGILSLSGFRERGEVLLTKHPDTPYFLSYNNIRDFKYINDSLGREAGDELLKFWAEKSLETLTDEEAIGRIDADHFAVLRRIEGEEGMREDEENVLEPVKNYFISQGKEHRVQICSGIYVLTPKDFREIDVDHMLDLARVAEKRARANREEDFAFYNPEQWEMGKQIADIVNHLPAAIRENELQVWYQPQVNFETGKITGAEALCRWDHTKLGWLYPTSFIATLEESGLIFDLDSYIWDRVCQDLRRWNEQGFRRSVSVNVSRADFREDRDIPGCFRNLIRTYGLTPDQLRIEITETAYVKYPEQLIKATDELRAFGFQVEMDDFGSGNSSLNMLKQVMLDRIKLDLHFLTETGNLERGRIIITHMVRMINSLGMEMIAEGVETLEQAAFLQKTGCSEMQGYYFYKPMPVQEFEKTMDAQ